jgi:hypothetical protein
MGPRSSTITGTLWRFTSCTATTCTATTFGFIRLCALPQQWKLACRIIGWSLEELVGDDWSRKRVRRLENRESDCCNVVWPFVGNFGGACCWPGRNAPRPELCQQRWTRRTRTTESRSQCLLSLGWLLQYLFRQCWLGDSGFAQVQAQNQIQIEPLPDDAEHNDFRSPCSKIIFGARSSVG